MDKRKDKDQDTYKHDCQDQAGDQGVWSPFISGEGPEFDVSIEGGLFNCSYQFSSIKWKTISSQSEILFFEILDVQKILVG